MNKFLMMSIVLAVGVVSLVRAQGLTDLGGFQTPSGNIHCAAYHDSDMGTSELRCDLNLNTARIPPRPKDCDLDWGNAFVLRERGRPQRLCHGDTVMNPKFKKLEYGKKWSARGISCDSSAARLRCVNRDGHGFELARAAQRLF